MTERLTHRRSKGPVSTPAQRLAELTGELAYSQRLLEEQHTKVTLLEQRLSRFQTIGGVSFAGIRVAQSWAEFVLWESLLNSHQFDAIIELGTWEGGFSWWLDTQAQARGIAFFTFDAITPDHHVPGFERVDVFAEQDRIVRLIQNYEPCILFCDNGNKPRELRTFGPVLQNPDSLVVVHDWGTEIQPKDVPDTVEMVYREFCEELGSMSRVFKRTQDA